MTITFKELKTSVNFVMKDSVSPQAPVWKLTNHHPVFKENISSYFLRKETKQI